MEHKCGDCALKALKHGMCPVFNANMEGKSGCPHFTTQLTTCDVCGNLILGESYLQEEDGVFYILCAEIRHCRFQTDQDCQEPPYVMVQQRQGNMVVQQQIQNPKRVQATCANGCPCYSEEHGCMREYGCGCNNHKFNWRK